MNIVHDPQRYQLSFTSGALHLRGAPVAAGLYRENRDWRETNRVLRANNLLQARTDATSARWARELIQRLEMLSDPEIDLLTDATAEESMQLVWAATCRKYSLIGEFAEEVLRERFLLLQPTLTHQHFDSFMSSKQLWHEELEDLTESTYRKLRSNLFAMLREAELITEEGVIIPVVLANRVRPHFARRVPSDIRFFPTREAA
ncbi:DUF1819 family protein [Salinibacterium amurskyense]|uniref:DUF1819 family protein n=1 Tax=Salinibacterium amurskyense TaxID=205941 RepID=UPI00311EEF6A